MKLIPLIAIAALSLAACTSAADTTTEGVSVVTSTTILGNITGDITECAGGRTLSLMPIGTDPHEFSPSSANVADMARATLVVVNGLGLEEGLAASLLAVKSDGAAVFEVGPLLNPTADSDPHVWLDMDRMATAAELIGAELATSTGDANYTTCASEVAAKIRAGEEKVMVTLKSIPEANRVLITDHDSLEYFADRYGFEIAATVIPSSSTLASASSADLANVVSTMSDRGLSTIFTNTSTPTTLADAIASELENSTLAGSKVAVVPLFIESVGPEGSGAQDYVSMMNANATLIADNLK
jgi:zinc/manganese transport system substrate-binding protein